MSHESRWRYSDINAEVQPVWVHGWARGWVTSCDIEWFNSVGAFRNANASFNATLVPVAAISPDLHKREMNYRFTELRSDELSFTPAPNGKVNSLSHNSAHRYWICETLQQQRADQKHPLLQTYIDTCLIGCLETDMPNFAHEFIESTQFWCLETEQDYWLNDRGSPKYPRAATINVEQSKLIDDLLQQFDLLQFRIEPPFRF